jgi:hypothetical protein
MKISNDPQRSCGFFRGGVDVVARPFGQSITGGRTLRGRLPLLFAIAALVSLGGAWALLDRGESDAKPTYVSEHPLVVPETARTITVSATMPSPSIHARRLSAMLEEGQMPAGPMSAKVLTDTECTPDAHMISRCRNEMLLPDGRKIVLRHPHAMSSIPCLAPGERVMLVPASA